MKLLNAMMAVQAEQGAVTDDSLKRLSREAGVPLYRLEGLRSFYPVFRERADSRRQLHVCRDVVCAMAAGGDPCQRVTAALGDRDDVAVHPVSCLGLCDRAPAALLDDVPVAADAEPLRSALAAEQTPPLPVMSSRPDRARRSSGAVAVAGSPLPTDPYALTPGRDAYAVARAQLSAADPEALIAALTDSGLRGLGGAAFPTGLKWAFTRKADGEPKTVVCNADESEPGTFKDRAILECAPHLVIEGMLLGAWVIGASRGIIYLRHEYAAAARALQQAIDAAYADGSLGANVLGAGFRFDLELFLSPGGYILGEETALLEALEDKRGEPRNKPPFPTTAGLFGKPTLINNVETFAAVPVIADRGADWWCAQGRDGFSGLKYVSVSGDVQRPGVYCVPWGSPVSDVLELCGGMRDDVELLAFSPGGASTPFLGPSCLETPLDFDAMQQAGSALGTGAMVFVGNHRHLLDIVLAQVRFFRNESCGKCVPCRLGSQKAVDMVERVMAGDLVGADDWVSLDALHQTLARTSICGLGQVALMPLVRALRDFPEEPSLQQLAAAVPAWRACP